MERRKNRLLTESFPPSRKYSIKFFGKQVDNQAERRVLVVKVLGVEFFDGSVFSHNLMCSFRLSSMEETQTIMLGNIGTEKVVWNGLGSMNAELTVNITRKRTLGSTTVCTCGPVPIKDLGLQDGPFERKFLLVWKKARVGKIHLNFSAEYDISERDNFVMMLHNKVVNKLTMGPGLTKSPKGGLRLHRAARRGSIGMAVASANASRKNSGSSLGGTPRTLSSSFNSSFGGGGSGNETGDEEVVGYMYDMQEEYGMGSFLYEYDAESDSDTFASSTDIPASSKFEWVLDVTRKNMEEAVVEVQKSWLRIQAAADIAKMVDLFYATAAGNPKVAALFSNTDWNAQKDKLTGALKLVLDNLHKPDEVLEKLRELAVRHVEYGVELWQYADVGNALVVALVDADPEIGKNPRLAYSWRLAYTMIATTMMEACRPIYMEKGKLPPGLELMGGDGQYRPIFYQFNERFQTCVSNIWKDETNTAAWNELADVCDDFEACATNLGKIIISEHYIGVDAKTIKPRKDAGGTIGGVKYCEQGVFFKFAIPDGKHVLSCKAAEKVAGHELKNCSSYFQSGVKGLHVPLICVVDYAGFRLVATSVLPISKETLVVGTNDGGRTIVAQDHKLLKMLRRAGKFLNVKEHMVGRTNLYGAADLEGHFSPTDNRRYLVDFSRAIPPDVEAIKRSREAECIYSCLLRPELVMQFKGGALNPDAFSGFKGTGGDLDDERFEEDCAAVSEASLSISVQCIRLAKDLDRLVSKESTLEEMMDFFESISRLFHVNGCNMRYLGQVAKACKNLDLTMYLFVEMAARVIKHHVRKRWREALATCGYGMVSALRKVVSEVFTGFLDSEDDSFWRQNIIPKVEAYFNVHWPQRNDEAQTESSPVVVGVTGKSAYVKTRARSQSMSEVSVQRIQKNDGSIDLGGGGGNHSSSGPSPRTKPLSRSATVAVRRKSGGKRSSLDATGRNRASSFSHNDVHILDEGKDWKMLSDMESEEQNIVRPVLLHRVCQMLGVKLSEHVLSAVREDKGEPVVVEREFITVEPRCKSMNIAAQGRAMAMMRTAKAATGSDSRSNSNGNGDSNGGGKKKSKVLVKLAANHFEAALNGPLVSGQLLSSYAVCLSHTIDNVVPNDPSSEHVESLFKQAMLLNTADHTIRINYAIWKERSSHSDAQYQWLRALDAAPAGKAAQYASGYIRLLLKMKKDDWAAEMDRAVHVYHKQQNAQGGKKTADKDDEDEN